MSKIQKLLLVDGNALFHRGYHAIPHLSNAEGQPTNGVYGFTMMLLKVLSDLKPKYAIVTWDKSSDVFRKKIYPEYKAQRKKQPDDLYAQIPAVHEVVDALGFPWIEVDNYEADDIIGTLATEAGKSGNLETIIVTGDLDELQLIDERTKVYTMRRGITDTTIYDLAALKERYGVTPEQFIDIKALKGDASDNIPGVEGVGEKTAINLITQYGSLDGVYENIEHIAGKLRERLEQNKDMAYLSQKLSRIVRDVPVKLELTSAEVGRYDRQKIHELFRRLDFKTLLAKLPPEMSVEVAPTLFNQNAEAPAKVRHHLEGTKYQTVTTEQQLISLVDELKNAKVLAFDTETDSVDEMSAKLVGISLSHKVGEAFYIPVGHESGDQLSIGAVGPALNEIFENPKIKKIGHNAKFDYKILRRHGVNPEAIAFDSMIAAFLTNPLGRSQSLEDLAYRELGIEMVPITNLLGTGRNQISFDKVEIDAASTYACEDTDISLRLYQKLEPELKKSGLNKLADSTEWPLIRVLGEMELTGIMLDVDFLKQFSKQLNRDILDLEEKICQMAGMRFNISSPAQLSQVLFEKLGLGAAGVRRGKTGGLSTAARELDKLRDAHPVVPLIVEFRELMKLKTTYVDALPLLVKDDGRIHTNFNQTIAQTGRLSSTNPNLQNIPVRTEIGREIRKAFIAPKGRVLVAADYSQIELRVAAALSKDKGMIETFRKGIDLHLQTAAELFGVPLDKVTKDQRYAAKTVNFGVLYGMSPHGLSVATGMTREEANAFISRYFELRQELAAYIEKVKKFAHENEYTETLFGRRRPCPEINSNNYIVANAAERMAVNVPIQGTATGDIMKMAMIALVPKLNDLSLQGASATKQSPRSPRRPGVTGTPRDDNRGTKLLLQIHDELIAETDDKQASKVAKIMKDTMENVYDLGVPIAVDTSVGKSWGELR